MTLLEMENPGPGANQAGADIEEDGRESSTTRNARQGPRVLIILARWLVRLEQLNVERLVPAGWDAALSLQLDRLTDIRERLAEYLNAERGQP